MNAERHISRLHELSTRLREGGNMELWLDTAKATLIEAFGHDSIPVTELQVLLFKYVRLSAKEKVNPPDEFKVLCKTFLNNWIENYTRYQNTQPSIIGDKTQTFVPKEVAHQALSILYDRINKERSVFSWLNDTTEVIRNIFGDDSVEMVQLKNIKFKCTNLPPYEQTNPSADIRQLFKKFILSQQKKISSDDEKESDVLDHNQFIELLEAQKWSLVIEVEDLKSSIESTKALIKKFYGIHSQEYSEFTALANQYFTAKHNSGSDSDKRKSELDLSYRRKINSHLLNLMDHTEDLKSFEQEKKPKAVPITPAEVSAGYDKKKDEVQKPTPFDKSQTVTNNVLKKDEPSKKQNLDVQQPGSLKKLVQSFKIVFTNAWTYITGIFVCSFFFGQYVGNTKFDSEKNRLYEENIQLKTDLKNARDTINSFVDTIINLKHYIKQPPEMIQPNKKPTSINLF